MKNIRLILVCLLASYAAASAKIGETSLQCKKRYGNPTAVDEKWGVAAFLKAEITIECYFNKQKVCVAAFYSKAGGRFTDGQIKALLKVTDDGSGWVEQGRGDDGGFVWMSKKERFAILSEKSDEMKVFTVEYLAELLRRGRINGEAEFKGF